MNDVQRKRHDRLSGFTNAVFLVMLVLGLSAVPATSMGVDFGTSDVYQAPTLPTPAPSVPVVPIVEEKEPPPVIEVKTKNAKRPPSMAEVQKAKEENAARFPPRIVAPLESGVDPCDDFKTCTDCTQQRQCGWCAANNKCSAGGPSKPKAAETCARAFWSFSFCVALPCKHYASCTTCLKDPSCGWCSAQSSGGDEASDSDETGSCTEGGANGPLGFGSDAKTCGGNWLHSPTRIGESPARVAMLNSRHARYLTQMCNAGTMNIQHALPPSKINPAVKAPVPISVAPTYGSTFGANELTITGLWFGFTPSPGLKAYMGDVECEETVWVSESIIKCIAAQHRPAGVKQVVVVRDGVWSNDTDAQTTHYEYREFSISHVSLLHGPTEGGTVLNITGKNFGIRDFDPEISVGGVPCAKSWWISSKMLQCVTPPHFGTNHSILITINGMTQLPENQKFFFNYDRPKIESVSIHNSPTLGNVTLTVTGKNFGTPEGFPIITIGGVGCIRQTRVSHTRLMCEVPPAVGQHHRVVVTTLDGRYTTEEELTISDDPPVIASISPDHGATLGNYEITITGINFGTGAISPDLTPQQADWAHRRLEYAQMRAGIKDSFGEEWNATGFGNRQWEPPVEETQAKEISESMSNDTAVKSTMFAAAEAAARGDIAGASAQVVKASEVAIEKLKLNLPKSSLAAALAVQNIVKASTAALSNVQNVLQNSSGFSGSDIKRAIAASVANATGEPSLGVGAIDQANAEKLVQGSQEDSQRNVVKSSGTVVEQNGFTSNSHESIPSDVPLFVELGSEDHSILRRNLAGIYSFIDMAHAILNSNLTEARDDAKNHMFSMFNTFKNEENKVARQTECIFTKGCVRTWEASASDEMNHISSVLSMDGLKIGHKYRISISGMFRSDRTEKAHSAECPRVEGFGAPRSIRCPTFYTPVSSLPNGLKQLEGKDKTMVQGGDFSGKLEFEAEATSDVAEFMTMHSSRYYKALGPIKMRILQLTPPLKAPKVVMPACPDNMGVDYTMAGPRCVSVLIGHQSCLSVEILSDTQVRCMVPPGVGANHSVTIIVGNQSSASIGNYDRIERLKKQAPHREISEFIRFSYDKPVVSGFSPDTGDVEGGNTLAITGFNFGPDKMHVIQNMTTIVTIGGKACSNTLWLSDKLIECKVPQGVGSNKEIVVTTQGQTFPPEGEACSKCNACCKPIYYNYNGPKIHKISPNHGSTVGGTTVRIFGQDFGDTDHLPTVMIDDQVCPEIMWKSKELIVCSTPAGWGTSKKVQVTVGDQSSRPGEVVFNYDPPEVFSVTPEVCPTRGKCLLRISGANFGIEQGDHLQVRVGGKTCANVGEGTAPLYVNQTSLECVVPGNVGKEQNVEVCVGSQCSTPNDIFSYRRPEVYEIRPRHGSLKGGGIATIIGVGFGQKGGASSVLVAKIGDVPCVDTKWLSDTRLECTLPNSYAGGFRLPVSVKVANQVSDDAKLPMAARFSYDAPEMHKFSISHGGTAGGYALTIEGFNFPVDSLIYFGDMEAFGSDLVACKNTHHVTRNKLKCIVPCGVAVGKDEYGTDIIPGTSHKENGVIQLSHQHNIQLYTNGRRFVQTRRKSKKVKPACYDVPDLTGQHLFRAGTNFQVNNFVSFYCDDEYDLFGNASMVCDPNAGKWIGKPPSCLKATTPKPSIPSDVFGREMQDTLLKAANLAAQRSGAGDAQRYDASALKMKKAAEKARAAGDLTGAKDLEKQAVDEERLAVKAASLNTESAAKKLRTEATSLREQEQDLLSQTEKLKEGTEKSDLVARAKTLNQQVLLKEKQASAIMASSPKQNIEPITIVESISKAELANQAHKDALKRLIHYTIREREIQQNYSKTSSYWDKMADEIARHKEKAQDDIAEAIEARKNALAEEDKAQEEAMKAAKGAAARAMFDSGNIANLSPNDTDAQANALNPSLTEHKMSFNNLVRARAKVLGHAARLKVLNYKYKQAASHAKGVNTPAVLEALRNLQEEMRSSEKTKKIVVELEAEEKINHQKSDEKQAIVAHEADVMVKMTKDAGLTSQVNTELERLHKAEAIASDIQARLPTVSAKGDASTAQRNSLEIELARVKSLLLQETNKPGKRDITLIEKLEGDVLALQKRFTIMTGQESAFKQELNAMNRGNEALESTRHETSQKMSALENERAKITLSTEKTFTSVKKGNTISKKANKVGRRRLVWNRQETPNALIEMMVHHALIEDDGLITVMKSFNFNSGELVEEYFERTSPEGAILDNSMFYTLHQGMPTNIAFDYDPPEVSRAYIRGESTAHGSTAGKSQMVVEGKNFGCISFEKANPDTGFNPIAAKKIAVSIEKDTKQKSPSFVSSEAALKAIKVQGLAVYFKETDSREGSPNSWVKCPDLEFISDNKLACATPSGSGTNIELKVTMSGQQSAPRALFNYDPPVVTQVITEEGNPEGKNWLTIKGKNFGPTRLTWGMVKANTKDIRNSEYATHSAVKIGEVYCIRSTWISDTEIRCMAPPGEPASRHIIVVGPVNGQFSDSKPRKPVFYSYGRPFVSQALPSLGVSAGNQTIKFVGRFFGECVEYRNYDVKGKQTDSKLYKYCPDVVAYVDCQKCITTTRISNTLIECVSPSGVGPGKFLDVHVGTNKVGVLKENHLFDYTRPTVTMVRPLHGPADGGNTITMTGYNFGIEQDLYRKGCRVIQEPTVMIGKIPCASISIISDTKLTCTLSRNPGVGKDLPITPAIGGLGRQSPMTRDARYSFDSPEVHSVVTSHGKNQLIHPRGYDWAFSCPSHPNGGCKTPDRSWTRENTYFTVTGKNFGTKNYNRHSVSILHAIPHVECGWGIAKGSAHYVSSTEMRCYLPSHRESEWFRSSRHNQPQRVWVKVAGQRSFTPEIPGSKELYYETTFLKFENRNLKGTVIKTLKATVDDCMKECKQISGCGAFTVSSALCSFYSKSAATSCGKSGEVAGTTAYVSEEIIEYGDCVAKRDLMYGIHVESVSPNEGTEEEMTGMITITGRNFGNPGSKRSQTIEAYYAGKKCLATEHVDDTTVKCRPQTNLHSTDNIVLRESFEAKAGYNVDLWTSTTGVSGNGVAGCGAFWGKAMQFPKGGSMVTTSLNLLRGAKMAFKLNMCKSKSVYHTDFRLSGAARYSGEKDPQGVSLSASLDGGKTWFEIANYNSFHAARGFHPVSIEFYNSKQHGDHPAASGSTLLRWKGDVAFAIDEILITNEAATFPVRVVADVLGVKTPTIKAKSHFIGLEASTSWSVAPDYREGGSGACTSGDYCKRSARTSNFPGFKWTMKKSRDGGALQDIPFAASASCMSSVDAGHDQKNCRNLFDHKGLAKVWKAPDFKTAWVETVVEEGEGAFEEVRITNTNAGPATKHLKEVLIEYETGKQTVVFDDVPDSMNIDQGFIIAKKVTPFVSKKIKLTVKSVYGGGQSGPVALGEVQYRGKLIRNTAGNNHGWGSVYQGCDGTEYRVGGDALNSRRTFFGKNNRKWACDKAFDKDVSGLDGHAWGSPWPYSETGAWNGRPQGKPAPPSLSIRYTKPQDVYSANLQQRFGYHAKKISFMFFDSSGTKVGADEKFEMKDIDGEMQRFKLDAPHKGVSKVQLQILDLFQTSARSPIPYFYDMFKTMNKNAWIFPEKPPYDMGIGSDAGHASGIYFNGDAENSVPPYTKYPWPAVGSSIVGSIVGDPSKCSDHFLMLSTKPQRKWSFGSSKDVIKFAWNCDEMAIYPMETSKNGGTEAVTDSCRAGNKRQNFQIQLDSDGISFYSTNCKEAVDAVDQTSKTKKITIPNPWKTKSRPVELYVYIGASQDRKQVTFKPYFEFLKIITSGIGMQEVEILSADTE